MPQREKRRPSESRAGARRVDVGIVTRLVVVFALTVMLVGAVRWAADVTHANTQRVATTLTRLQTQIGQATESADPRAVSNDRRRRAKGGSDSVPGPSVEPAPEP
jgi:hypothetical protein